MATFQPDLRRTFPKPPPIATGPGGVPVGSPTVPEAAGLGNFIPTLGPHIVPGSAAAPTQGGVPDMTLDALMARQKELASQQSEMPTMMAPTQGLAYALQQGMQGFQRGRTDRDTTRSRDELAQIMSEVDPATGPNQEQMGRLMQISPELGLKLYEQGAGKAKTEHWVDIPTPQGENGQWQQNTANGQTRKVGGGNPGEGGWKPSDLGGLRDDYTKAAATYEGAAPRWDTMKQAAAISFGDDEGSKGGADYNLIVGFAKLLDPTSVVREGEVKSAGDLGGYINTVNSWLNKWKENGGKIDDTIRESIMQQSQLLMHGYYNAAKQKRDWISGIAQRNKVNPDDVVPPLPEFQGWQRDTSNDPPPSLRD